ncbi:hypothetical protein Godav_019693, partial [Gossypium davidsonii]|nr:hypothetical protein [Gossypium davidsonii]MBA0642386.1 hypothetical protein [Gossypium klotzschianum]
WLTWAFGECSTAQKHSFCYALWANWGDRNTNVHERKIRIGRDTACYIENYLIKGKPSGSSIKINFDGAYDGRNFRSASGAIARNAEGQVMFSWSEIHNGVLSAFILKAISSGEKGRGMIIEVNGELDCFLSEFWNSCRGNEYCCWD